jgi:hypothetical protein
LLQIGTFFLIAQSLIRHPEELKKPLKFKIPKWNSKAFFDAMAIILCLVIFIIMGLHAEGSFYKLLGLWYFTGTLWLLCLCMLATEYIKEKEKMPNEIASPNSDTAAAESE